MGNSKADSFESKGSGAPAVKSEPHDGKLRFLAKGDLLVTVPGSRALKYVGRKTDGKGAFPAVEKSYEADPDSDRGRRLIKLTRRDSSLFPADEFTAKACGVDFQKTRFDSGAHVAESAKGNK